jgi:hypothetical protein
MGILPVDYIHASHRTMLSRLNVIGFDMTHFPSFETKYSSDVILLLISYNNKVMFFSCEKKREGFPYTLCRASFHIII